MTWAEKRATDGGTLQMRADYKYDVFGNRIEAAVDPDGAGPSGTTTTRFAYDGSEAWADMDGSNNLLMRRLYLDTVDSVFARIDSSGNGAWYLADRLGSVRQIANVSGTVQDTIAYDGFGNVTSESSPSAGDRYKWTGQETDSETGLQRNGWRYYDPKVGRWTSQDPI